MRLHFRKETVTFEFMTFHCTSVSPVEFEVAPLQSVTVSMLVCTPKKENDLFNSGQASGKDTKSSTPHDDPPCLDHREN